MVKKILLLFIIGLVVIQFIHPEKNKTPGPQINYIGNAYTIPGDVKIIMAKACNDCHSNNTNYPWYSLLQPADWWMNHHIKEAKAELNFDEYTNRNLRFQYHKMEEIVEQVKEGEMPLNSYTWIHREANLSETEKTKLINWADGVMVYMKGKYPLDSLLRKK